MKSLEISIYFKPYCIWTSSVREIMKKYDLKFKEFDVINNPKNYDEMIAKSGQRLTPCVEINDVMLIDVSGEDVENYLLSNNLVNSNIESLESVFQNSQTIRFF